MEGEVRSGKMGHGEWRGDARVVPCNCRICSISGLVRCAINHFKFTLTRACSELEFFQGVESLGGKCTPFPWQYQGAVVWAARAWLNVKLNVGIITSLNYAHIQSEKFREFIHIGE